MTAMNSGVTPGISPAAKPAKSAASQEKAPLGLSITAVLVLLFLHVPIWIILLYTFTTDLAAFTGPHRLLGGPVAVRARGDHCHDVRPAPGHAGRGCGAPQPLLWSRGCLTAP